MSCRILVLMPPGARKMEQFRATQVANEIRDEDHAGNAEVEIIGIKIIILSRKFIKIDIIFQTTILTSSLKLSEKDQWMRLLMKMVMMRKRPECPKRKELFSIICLR